MKARPSSFCAVASLLFLAGASCSTSKRDGSSSGGATDAASADAPSERQDTSTTTEVPNPSTAMTSVCAKFAALPCASKGATECAQDFAAGRAAASDECKSAIDEFVSCVLANPPTCPAAGSGDDEPRIRQSCTDALGSCALTESESSCSGTCSPSDEGSFSESNPCRTTRACGDETALSALCVPRATGWSCTCEGGPAAGNELTVVAEDTTSCCTIDPAEVCKAN